MSLCVIGSIVGAIGAAFISSGSNEWEDLGMAIHQGGLFVMLIGFGGLLIRGRAIESNTENVFGWQMVDSRVLVHPTKPSEVLLVPNASPETGKTAMGQRQIAKSAHEQVQCVVWPDQAIRVDEAAQLVMLKNLRVLDLSQCSDMSDEVAAELEGLEQAECLMLPKSTSMKAFKRLRIALPEALLDESRQQVIIHPLMAIRRTGRSIA
jgi:hypothetical protein